LRTFFLCLIACTAVLCPSSLVLGQPRQLIAPTDALPPEQQREKFHLPPGFEIQLIVSDETIGQPMNLNFDAAGRLWITSSVTYPFPVEEEGVEPRDERFGPNDPPPPRDWVTVVEGIGADGTPDRVWRFVGGLNIPIGIVPVKDGTRPSCSITTPTEMDGRTSSSGCCGASATSTRTA